MVPTGEPDVDWTAARIPVEKFEDYSMNPGHADNGGKHQAFAALRWDLCSDSARESAAREVIERLSASLPPSDVTTYPSAYGRRLQTRTVIVGPNGRSGSLIAVWQQDAHTTSPRLITNWLEVHKERPR